MSAANERIRARLVKAEERKPFSISFRVEDIRKLDLIAKAITKYSGNSTTRNMLIEEAIDSYIEEAIEELKQEGIELNVDEDDSFDTIVCPAKAGDEYRQAFFDELEWRFVRVAESKKNRIKYIAIYVSAPQSSISHYAKVDKLVYDGERKKYRIKLDGDPIPLPNPIPLGSSSPLATRSPKYTTLQKLFTASEFKDLYGAAD